MTVETERMDQFLDQLEDAVWDRLLYQMRALLPRDERARLINGLKSRLFQALLRGDQLDTAERDRLMDELMAIALPATTH